MFTRDIKIELKEYHGNCEPLDYPPTLMHINSVIGEADRGSDDAARTYLSEIYIGTIYRGVTEIPIWPCDVVEKLNELKGYANKYFAFLEKFNIRYDKDEAESLFRYIDSMLDGGCEERPPLYRYYQTSYNLDKCKHNPETIAESLSKIYPGDFDEAVDEILNEENEYYYPLLIQVQEYAKQYFYYCDQCGVEYDKNEKAAILQRIASEIKKLKVMK